MAANQGQAPKVWVIQRVPTNSRFGAPGERAPDISHGRLPEEDDIFATELRGAFVADLKAAAAASRPLFNIRLRAD